MMGMVSKPVYQLAYKHWIEQRKNLVDGSKEQCKRDHPFVRL
jgi:hypothetical protein